MGTDTSRIFEHGLPCEKEYARADSRIQERDEDVASTSGIRAPLPCYTSPPRAARLGTARRRYWPHDPC